MRSETSRNTWFAVSATECAPSARIAAEPEMAPATNLARAISRFAPAATRTVFLLSEATSAPVFRLEPRGGPARPGEASPTSTRGGGCEHGPGLLTERGGGDRDAHQPA